MITLDRHPWNTGFTLARAPGPVPRGHARAGAGLRRARASSCSRTRSTPATIAALAAAIAPFDQEVLEFLGTQPDGRFSIAGVDTVSIAVHLVPRSRGAARLLRRHRCSPTSATTSSGPTPASTGSSRCTSSRTAPSPSSGTRTTATRTSSRRRTSRAGSRSPTRRSRTAASGCCPACTAAGTVAHRGHPDRLPVLRRPARRGRRPGAGRQHRRVLVAHAARDRAQHTDETCARPTSSSTHPTARSPCRAIPRTAPPPPASRRTTPPPVPGGRQRRARVGEARLVAVE